MADPLSTADDALPALELVIEHARECLAQLDGPVRTAGADEAPRGFA